MNIRRILRTAAAAGLALLPLAAVPASAADDVNRTALQRLGACINGGGTGQMLLLMDRSRSLQRTDPDGARVKAAEYVVRQLNAVAQIYRWKIDIAVAGFDTGFEKKLDWTTLNPSTLGSVEDVIESFRSENNGLDTDYWNALDNARRELDNRSTIAGSCSFIAWFSDGELSIEPRAGGIPQDSPDRKPYMAGNTLATKDLASQAEDAAEADLCRAGGIADQVRSQDIITLAVGLSTPNSKPDFTLLRGVATGSGMTCGAITSPAPGAFFTADGIDALYQAFDQIASPAQEATVQESEVCPAGVTCPAGTHQFVLDGSIGAVHALATTGATGQKVVVSSPAGEQVEIQPGGDTVSTDLSGATLTAEWLSERSVSIDLTRRADAGWSGDWGIAFVAPEAASGTARSSLRLYGDLLPAVKNLDKLTFNSGTEGPEVQLVLGRADGSTVDPASVSSTVKLSAELVQQAVSVPLAEQLDAADLANPVKTDLSKFEPGPATLHLTLAVTTAAWTSAGRTIPGTPLEPQVRDYAVQILPPASYPVVAALADFGSTDKVGQVSTKLELSRPGCAWLGQPVTSLAAPEGMNALQVTSPASSADTCVSGELPLTAQVTELGNGLASGTLTVMTLPENKAGNPVPVTVKYELDVQRPVSVPVLLGVLVGVTAAGILIPLALLYMVKYLTAKIPGDSVAWASARGQVNESSSFVAGGVPITVQDLRTVVLTGANRRNVVIGDGKSLVARMGASPTESGHAVLDQQGVAAGGRIAGSTVKGKARLPLAVQGNWSVGLDPVDPRGGEVDVTIFTAPGGAGLTELLEDVRGNIGEWVAKLRANLPDAVAPQGGAQASDAWGGATAPAAAADEWDAPTTGMAGDAWSSPYSTAPYSTGTSFAPPGQIPPKSSGGQATPQLSVGQDSNPGTDVGW